MEKKGKLSSIITQNIDGLHSKAGNKRVLELHGSVHRNYCMKCNKSYTLTQMMKLKDNLRCSECGGLLKPDVVLYEEMLNEEILDKSIEAIKEADLLIIAGTSLVVAPASSLPYLFKGSQIAIVNLGPTPFDKYASIKIEDKVERVFQHIKIRKL